MKDMLYKLPLDGQTDKDLIKWIDSMPRNKKAEVMRHALRFYMAHLTEGETLFVMPNTAPVSPAYAQTEQPANPVYNNDISSKHIPIAPEPEKEVREKPVIKKKPPKGLGGMIRGE